jgi:hypothetical protein
MKRKVFLEAGAAFAASALGLSALPAMAQTAAPPTTLAGVKLDPEVTVAGQKLQLNGSGVRVRAVFRVYVAALYTPTKMTKNEDVLKPSTKRLQLVALRDVKGDDFGKLFSRGIEDNTSKEEFAKSINNVVRMGQIFADAKNFYKGDVITLDFTPTALTVFHKGKQLGEPFREPEFQGLMLRIWFGQKPADNELRKALLGEQTTANTNMN